jgi:hypothetical protein
MTNRLMMSVAAAALIAGAGSGHAQGTSSERERSPAGSSAQQSAPAPEHKATQSEENSPGAAKSQRTGDKDMQGQPSKSMSSEQEGAKGSKEMKAEGREGKKDMKAEGREGTKDMKAQGREGQTTTEQKGAADTKSQTTTQSQTGQSTQSQTTGQAGAGAKLSTEQRTQITSVIKEQHVQPTTNVNFSISVGTRVPRDVTFHTLPERVVTIYPEWRGFKFILVKEQIVIVDPNTYEIVAIIEA